MDKEDGFIDEKDRGSANDLFKAIDENACLDNDEFYRYGLFCGSD